MTHEPECTYRTETAIMSDVVVSPCICDALRAAYQRGADSQIPPYQAAYDAGWWSGMQHAAYIAQKRHDEMLWCNNDDECRTIAEGAELAAEDIRYEMEKRK